MPSETQTNIVSLAFHDNLKRMSPQHVKREIDQEAVICCRDQPAHFQSQESLFLWLAESSSIELEHVEMISLRITDIDMIALIDPTPPSSSSPSEPRIWEMYEKELEKICGALGRFPNLCTLTILEPRALHSYLFRDLYTRILQRLPVCLPAGCVLSVPHLGNPLDVRDEGHARTTCVEKDYVRSDSTRPDTPPTTPRSKIDVLIKDEPV